MFGCKSVQYGSFEKHSLALAGVLHSLGAQVYFCYDATPSSQEYLAELNAIGVTLIARPVFSSVASAVLWSSQMVREIKPGIIHVHFGYMRHVVALLRAMPSCRFRLVYTRHGITPQSRRISTIRQRWLWSRADQTIAVSRAVANNMLEMGLPQDKLSTIYLGLDVDKGMGGRGSQISGGVRLYLMERYSIPTDVPLVVSTSHFRYGKGMDMLVAALNDIIEAGIPVYAVLAGAGPLFDSIRLNARHRDNIIFPGIVDDVYPLLEACDVFAFPTVGTEGMGMSVLEAMAAGCTVVSTRVSDIPDFIRHRKSGFLIEPGDLTALRRELVNACSLTISARREIGFAAREAVRSLGVNESVKKIAQLYMRLIEGSEGCV